jgi:hypothetical protein
MRTGCCANMIGDAILKLKCTLSRVLKPRPDYAAVDDDQAHAMIDGQEGSVRSDLKVLVDMDGKPLWDGKSAIQVREATAEQDAEWKRSRDQAIIDGEIDLDAGNNPDEWNVYLMGASRTNKGRRKN